MSAVLCAHGPLVVNSDVPSSIVVGTAGHVDHGKSALVKALTGTDPDRLQEEKARGITIDLGFAHAEIGPGSVASFIDVPGHERFVRNMLAGVHGIDAVVLVVAADEGVMPQTREHFHICRLLGVPQGLVAVTKADLADADGLGVVAMEVRELVAGSFLEGAPVLPVSSRTGSGLLELREALVELAGGLAPRPAAGLVRLPVDRAFTVRGFGTVVTGTLVSGSLAVGDELTVMPAGQRVRVRGLQTHGEAVGTVAAGQRAAVNLAGVATTDVPRGVVLSRPGELRPTWLLDGEITVLPDAEAIRDGQRVRAQVASGEVLARVRVLGGVSVESGAAGLVQLRLEQPVAAGRGDRLVLRSYSPATTIAGVRVLDPLPPKRRRGDLAAVERIREAAEDLGRVAALFVQEAGVGGAARAVLAARLTVPEDRVLEACRGREDVLAVGPGFATFMSREALDRLGAEVKAAIDLYHSENPLRSSMPREEVRRRVFAFAPEAAFPHVLAELAQAGAIRVLPDAVARAGHAVRLTREEAEARDALVRSALQGGLTGVVVGEVAKSLGRDLRLLERVAQRLGEEGLLLRVGEGFLAHRDVLDALKADVRRRWPPGTRLDVGEFKTMTGLTRKFVIPLLEFLDRERITRRAGPDRQVVA